MLTESQLALRRTGITASEVAIVAGLSKRKSAFAVWLDKVEGRVEGEEDHGPGYATGVRARGNFLERGVLDWWLSQRAPEPRLVRYADEVGTLPSRSSPILMGTPDMLAYFEGDAPEPVDAKTSRELAGWGIAGTDVVPDEYRAQVTVQMESVGAPRAHLPVYFPRFDEFRAYHVAFDADFFGLLAESAARFHRDFIVTKRPPPADYSRDDVHDWLHRRFPSEVGDKKAVRPATEEEEGWAMRLQRLDRIRMKVEPLSKALTARLKERIGEAPGLVFGNGTRATWTKNTDGESLDWMRVAWWLKTQLIAAVDEYGNPIRDAAGAAVHAQISDELWSDALKANMRVTTGSRVFRKSWTRQKRKDKGA